ncbi:MAG TPA: zf-HC2 domain-containing protein [Myxococcota bacterium]|nr:zf-HC2 domain-containing protein [Myxococcota bacterium]
MSALDRILEVAVARPCDAGAPRLHRLLDGELTRAQARETRAHVRGCVSCRAHLQFLELEEQTIRELAAPTRRRFVELWADRLEQKLAAAIAEQAGEERQLPASSGSATTRSSCSNVCSPTRSRTV